jgi:hypothetical protein
MPLVDSLLTAIVRSDGDALVLHVGEKPYVVAAAGTVELSRQGLGLGAMEGLLAQLLSADALRGLREMGAVEHELAASPAGGADRFTVVAARGGDDIWIEVRRHRRVRAAAPAATSVATAAIAEAAGHAAAPVSAVEPAPRAAHDVARPEVPPAAAAAPPSPAASSVPPGEATVVEELPVAVPAESPVADAMPPAEEVAAEVSVVDTWAAEHVPAIDFERPLAAAVPPIEFGPPPVVAAPASFEAALPAGAVPPVAPMPSAPVEAAPGPVTAPAAEATVRSRPRSAPRCAGCRRPDDQAWRVSSARCGAGRRVVPRTSLRRAGCRGRPPRADFARRAHRVRITRPPGERSAANAAGSAAFV